MMTAAFIYCLIVFIIIVSLFLEDDKDYNYLFNIWSTKLNYGQFVQYIHMQYEKITVIRGRWEGDNEVS